MNNDNGFKNKNLWKPLKKVYRKTPLPRIRNAFAQRRIIYRYSRYGVTGGSIRLEVSSACQLRCVLCARTHSRLKGHFDKVVKSGCLSFDNFHKLIERNPWITNIEISNWGEIFLNQELKKIFQYSYQKNIVLSASNGVNLNSIREDMIECLVKYRFNDLRVSLDGASDDTYKIYRVGGDFSKVIENVKRINYYKQKYNSNLPHLTWQFVIFGHNEHEIPIARKMATDLGMSFICILNHQFWDPPYSPIRDKEFVKRETGLEFATTEEFEKKYKESPSACPQMWEQPQINWDGKLLGCCVNFFGDYGNVFETGLTKCLKGEKYKYAKRMLLGLEKVRGDIPCAKCYCFKNRPVSKIRKNFGLLSTVERYF